VIAARDRMPCGAGSWNSRDPIQGPLLFLCAVSLQSMIDSGNRARCQAFRVECLRGNRGERIQLTDSFA
jgi:hypothetical protein